MNGKQIKTIFILILIGLILYFIIIGQINNRLVSLRMEITELKNNYDIIKNETDSIVAEIQSLLSLNNLEKIAKEKNFNKPTKEQVVYIK